MSDKKALLVLNQSPFACDLTKQLTVLDSARARGALLMMDAVYFATTPHGKELMDRGFELYALRHSLESRGVADRVAEGVRVIDYGEAVDLIMEEYDLCV